MILSFSETLQNNKTNFKPQEIICVKFTKYWIKDHDTNSMCSNDSGCELVFPGEEQRLERCQQVSEHTKLIFYVQSRTAYIDFSVCENASDCIFMIYILHMYKLNKQLFILPFRFI